MTTATIIQAQHLVQTYAMAARLSSGFDSLAVRLAAVRASL